MKTSSARLSAAARHLMLAASAAVVTLPLPGAAVEAAEPTLELQPRSVRVVGDDLVGRFSQRTLTAAILVSRNSVELVGSRVTERPFERRLPIGEPTVTPSSRAVRLEVVLFGPDGQRFTQPLSVQGLCLDHEEDAEPHVEGDTIRLHQESVIVELPDLPGFVTLEVDVHDGAGDPGSDLRPLGVVRLDGGLRAGSSIGEGPVPEQTLGAVHWPEEYGDPDIYSVQGDEGEIAKRINVVIVPDGYTYAQKSTMQSHFQSLVAGFRAKTPYKEHDPFMNYILVYAYSTAGGTDQCDCSVVVDTAMNTGFPNQVPTCGDSANRCLYYGPRSGTCDVTSTANISAAELRAPAVDKTIIMVNTTRYGGCGGYRAVYSAGNGSAIEVAFHELGHSLGGLDDEYTSTSGCGSDAGEINTSLDGVSGAWPEWVGELGTPRQGAQYYTQCIYRPRDNCEMRALFQPFCEVCNQRWSLVTFGHFRVAPTAPIESASPASPVEVAVGEPVTFEVSPRLSVGDIITNTYVWRLQGPGFPTPTVVATVGPSYQRDFTDPGTYTLSCELTADTNFVKPSRTGSNRDTVSWTVEVGGTPTRSLTVQLAGEGTGAVSSAPEGIDCPDACSAAFLQGSTVTLTASPDGGSLFAGWSGGGCTGTDPCELVMDAATTVTATFDVGLSPTALAVDADPAAGSSGDLNGVLEPGETVAVTPTWANAGASLAATGAASNLVGPAGATYSIEDGAADYGTLTPGGSADCDDATGDCYLLAVSNPAVRPMTHWDAAFDEAVTGGGAATWTLHVGASFDDVPPGAFAYRYVETLLHSGLTAGCSATTFCPSASTNRWQMAVFLARALTGDEVPTSGTVPGLGDYDCSPGGSSVFADIAPEDPGCPFIHYIAAEEITVGCGGGDYCPESAVSRWQMAVFLAKALTDGVVPVSGTVPGMGSYDCVPGGASVFADVPPTDPGCPYIHFIAAAGITAGCGGGNYCPASALARDQMAVFMTKAFDLILYGP